MLDFDSDDVSAWKKNMSWVGVFGALSRIGLQSQADHGPVFSGTPPVNDFQSNHPGNMPK